MPGFDYLEREPLDLEMIRVKGFGERGRVCNLTGEPLPVRVRRGATVAHLLHRCLGGNRPCVGTAIEHHGQTGVVVAVTVRDVDRREPPIVQLDRVGQRSRLADGHERVHQHGVAGTEDQRRRGGIPRRQVAEPGRRCFAGL